MKKKRIIRNGVPIYNMANIDKRELGLPVNIWIESSYLGRNNQHHLPRLKIQIEPNNDNSQSNLVPVLISKEPKLLVNKKLGITNRELNKIFEFIKNNYDVLMQHWNNEISDFQLGRLLKF